ncbi:hypothetical protein GQ53DRAFT_798935 [Thozetella sp. PMI_491]|nr:hypothetical protein GQ53DRAFT_798935 [Thozetella sp. PMI_491]
MDWPILLSDFHLPLNPVDQANSPPLYFVWVQDGCILTAGVLWTTAYLLYIRQAFRDKSYGMPLAALCGNIGWEFVWGVLYPPSVAEMLTFVPWLMIDAIIVYTTVKFGPAEWKQSPMISNNLILIITAGSVLVLLVNLALVWTFASTEEAGFWAGFSTQCVLGSASVVQLMARGRTSGQSFAIWLTRTTGTATVIAMFHWRYWHYPADYPYVGTPMARLFSTIMILADCTYGLVYWNVVRQQKVKAQ